MIFLNEYEIEEAEARLRDIPHLHALVVTLINLREWVDSHSDGWPYWNPPVKAAAKLMILIDATRFNPQDCTIEAYRAALRPIKVFRTKANRGDGTWGIRTPDTCNFEIMEVST
jgi:hypothetical protein